MYALFLGPSGFGVVNQLFNFVNLVSNTINLGLPLGLSTRLPPLVQENTEESKSKIRAYIEYFIKISLVISFPVTLLLIIFSDSISYLIIGSYDYKTFFIIIMLCIPFLVLYSLVESLIRGMSEIKILVNITVISAIVSTAILIPIIYYFNFEGVAYYLLVFSLIPLSTFIIKYRGTFGRYFNSVKTTLSSSEKSIIYKIGFVALLSSMMQQGSMIVLRRLIIGNLGFEDNGIYQSVLSLSLNAFTLIYIFLTNYTLPKLSSLKNKNEIVSELNNNYRFLLLILIPIVILIFTYKDFIIVLLYSKSFSDATGLLKFQLIGDIFKASAALFGLWLIPQMKIKQLILIDLIFNFTFLLTPFIALEILNYDLDSIPICYLLSFTVHFLLYFFYSRKEIKFKFDNKVFKNVIFSSIIIFMTFLMSIYFYHYSLFSNIIILFIWSYMVIEKSEKLKIYSYLKKLRK
ncbi:MAG: oligosaccharide flippase family protein [Ignavibacteria bacterium]